MRISDWSSDVCSSDLGIADGFLAPYKVVRIGLDKDMLGWRPEHGQLDKHGQLIEDREYNLSDFDRNLFLEKRTELVAAKVSEFLRTTNRFAKTINLCETTDNDQPKKSEERRERRTKGRTGKM